MKVLVVADQKGAIKALAACRAFITGQDEPVEISISATPLKSDTGDADQLRTQLVDLPSYLDRLSSEELGKALMDMERSMYLDWSAERPTLCDDPNWRDRAGDENIAVRESQEGDNS